MVASGWARHGGDPRAAASNCRVTHDRRASKELKASHELEKDEEADEDREVLRQWSQIGRGKQLAIAGPDEERTQSVEVQGP